MGSHRQGYRMVPLSMILNDPWHRVAVLFFKIKILKNGARQSYSYYWTFSRTHLEWCEFQWFWITPNSDFKVSVLFKCEYLNTVHFKLSSFSFMKLTASIIWVLLLLLYAAICMVNKDSQCATDARFLAIAEPHLLYNIFTTILEFHSTT